MITDENEILAKTLKYNIGVLTKNKVATQDLPEVMEKNELHKKIMKDKTKGAPLSVKTYKAVLNMARYMHGKEWDATFLEALASERMKELITKNCPKMQIGGMKGNSSSEHLIVVKTWMKTNEVGETTCIFKAFDMEKFFDL